MTATPKTWAQIANRLRIRAYKAIGTIDEHQPRKAHERELQRTLQNAVRIHTETGRLHMEVLKHPRCLAQEDHNRIVRWDMKRAIRSFIRALRLVQAYEHVAYPLQVVKAGEP